MEKQIILLAGNNSFFRKKEKDKIIDSFRKEKGNGVSFFALNPNSSEELKAKISQKIKGFSLFAEEELIVIKVEKSEKKAGTKKKEPLFCESFLASLCLLKASTIQLLIEIDGEIREKDILVPALSKIGGTTALFFNINPKEASGDLRNSIREYLSKEKISVDNFLIEKLIMVNGGDFWGVFSSLNQASLLFHAKNQSQGEEDLITLWNLKEEEKIFALLDAIGKKDQQRTIGLLYKIIQENTLKFGDEKKAILGLISLLRRQIKQMLSLKGNLSQEEAFKKWKIPYFAFSKVKFHSSLFAESFLLKSFDSLVSLSEKVKSGQNSPLPLLDFLVLRLISH